MLPECIENLNGARPQVIGPTVVCCEFLECLDAEITDRLEARLCELLGGFLRDFFPTAFRPADFRKSHLMTNVADGMPLDAEQLADLSIGQAGAVVLANRLEHLGPVLLSMSSEAQPGGEGVDRLLFHAEFCGNETSRNFAVILPHKLLFGFGPNPSHRCTGVIDR